MPEIEIIKTANITLVGKEIEMLKAICQNLHENYHDNKELMRFAEKVFYALVGSSCPVLECDGKGCDH